MKALGRALAAVVAHHDGLRLRYRQDAAGAWHQSYEAQGPQELLWVRHAHDAAHAEVLCEEAQCSLDLAQGPLLRALVIDGPDGAWRLLLVVHHLVVDGVSWRVLLEDLRTGYEQAQAQRDVVLPAKTASTKDWALALSAYAGEHGEAEQAHWASLAGTPVGLPVDRPEGRNTVADQQVVEVRLDEGRTTRLLKEAPAAYRTQVNDLLLTALGRALCGWSGHERILVDLEGHGREDLGGVDLSRTVGWFTSVHPVALAAGGEPGVAL
ncbi:condensation domain-containing protein, partial [Rhizobacter sp. Root1221]|uniref:condensation domain-containing protein n=1 Tax=Rhizobacter sp. Root1221 TaxID=1736433 RepID=UPI0035156184